MPEGQKVYIPKLGVFGEVLEISNGVGGLITKIRIANADGTFSEKEVSELVVHAVVVVKDVVASDMFKVIANWVKSWFKRK